MTPRKNCSGSESTKHMAAKNLIKRLVMRNRIGVPGLGLGAHLVEGQINWNTDSERQGEGWGVMERE
jgi:hypothetical protein